MLTVPKQIGQSRVRDGEGNGRLDPIAGRIDEAAGGQSQGQAMGSGEGSDYPGQAPSDQGLLCCGLDGILHFSF